MSTKMTVSLHKKSKEKRYRDVFAPSDANLYAPLTEDLEDEDAIDRLLMNTGFDAENDHEPPAPWNPWIEEREGPVDFATLVEERPAANKIEPLITLDEEAPAVSLSSIDPVQNRPEPPFADNSAAAETIDFAVESESWRLDEHSALALPGAIREEKLRIEDLVELGTIPSRIEPIEDDPAETPVPFGQSQSSSIDEEPLPVLEYGTSERRVISAEEKEFRNAMAAQTKKAFVFSCIALGISVGSAAVAVFALTATEPSRQAPGLSAQTGLPRQETSGPAQNNGIGKTAEHETPSETLLPVAMPNGGTIRQTSFEKSFDAGSHSSSSGKAFTMPETTNAKPGWFVNLVSFRQRSDAEQQALQLIKKGVRTEIVEVEVDQSKWYRLRVGGFTRQEQAAAYAEKIKKPLQLDSIWVANS